MLQAVRQFADPEVAHDFFVQIRWPNGVACPRSGCGSAHVAYLKNVRRWYCNDCKKQFSAKVGTIFEDSPIGLDKWLPAIWLLASNRNGISSHELARALKVTQKTAWFMLHRIRETMGDKPLGKFAGPVEADEVYIGGKTKDVMGPQGWLIHGAKSKDKTPVVGIVERKGNVRAFVVEKINRDTMLGLLRAHVEPGAVVYTDAFNAYRHAADHFVHHIINHSKEYVRGHIHTNNIEGFWSVFKRTIKGTYVKPQPQHLQRYVEEQVFRFNAREEQDGPRFAKATKATDGKRLTYKVLTAKE